ncbi:MAG: sulfatase-like hydrolase/transferase [Myxococcales bacterium]|nr:sulfatase-like hydrolase/transferase [Myxococcales bacterium]
MLDALTAKRLVPVLGAVAIALAVFLSLEARYGANAPPTVIFIVMDTLRADRASLCGYVHPTTPTLEELVDGGASYACNSHAPSTWTLPSHATFFTGLGPEDHQAGSGGKTKGMTWGSVTPLGPRLPTLAEEMAARGYQTLLLSGNPVVGERMGLTRGFGHAVVARSYPEMHDHRLADRLKLILQYLALDPDRPLFAFINIADPHAPWRGIPEDEGFLPARPPMMIDPGRARFESGEMGDEEAEAWLSHMSDVYDYSVLRADRSLARVLGALEADGWLDAEYRLVITSDHGEYLGEHRLVEHGRPYFYEPVTRVPLLFFSTEGKVELPDDVPSIVVHSLARDGVLPEPLPTRLASVFRKGSEPSSLDVPCSSSSAALWLGESKLVANQGEVVRYDLRPDPSEKQPLPADDQPAAAKLLEYCRALDRAYASRPVPDAELSEELSAQLKALGYLRDDDEPPQPSNPH